LPTAPHSHLHVVAILGVGGRKGQHDRLAQHGTREVVLERAAVHRPSALAGTQQNARDRTLPTTQPVVLFAPRSGRGGRTTARNRRGHYRYRLVDVTGRGRLLDGRVLRLLLGCHVGILVRHTGDQKVRGAGLCP